MLQEEDSKSLCTFFLEKDKFGELATLKGHYVTESSWPLRWQIRRQNWGRKCHTGSNTDLFVIRDTQYQSNYLQRIILPTEGSKLRNPYIRDVAKCISILSEIWTKWPLSQIIWCCKITPNHLGVTYVLWWPFPCSFGYMNIS